MKKPSSGYVYVASVKNHPNLCKIGYTKKNPSVRVSELKSDYKDLGFEFELFYHCESPRPKRHENLCHEILADHNFSREVFNVNPEFGSEVVNRCSGKWFKVLSASMPCNTRCLSDKLNRLSKQNESAFMARCNKWFEENNVRFISYDQVQALESYVDEVFV